MTQIYEEVDAHMENIVCSLRHTLPKFQESRVWMKSDKYFSYKDFSFWAIGVKTWQTLSDYKKCLLCVCVSRKCPSRFYADFESKNDINQKVLIRFHPYSVDVIIAQLWLYVYIFSKNEHSICSRAAEMEWVG